MKLYFQVMFLLLSPLSLRKFPSLSDEGGAANYHSAHFN